MRRKLGVLLLAIAACSFPSEAGPVTQALSGIAIPDDAIQPRDPVGTLEGQWSVSNGSASYGVPLAVPPGRAGMVPAVSLQYGDGSGNGMLGVGWSLSASSSIRPCRRTAADDGEPDRIRFDSTDVYCLDGQRLFESNVSSSGTEYRLRPDRFWRIRTEGTEGGVPLRFIVEDGSGSRSVYETRIKAQRFRHERDDGESPTSLGEVVWSWQLSYREDVYGNRVTYRYDVDTRADAALSYRLKRIVYSSNQSAGLVATRRVVFRYNEPAEERADVQDAYVAGVHLRQERHLVAVEMYAPNPVAVEKVWDYRLSYGETASGRLRLESLTRCDQFGACLLPTTFQWEEPEMSYERVETSISRGRDYRHESDVMVADFNGDGFDDMMFWRAEVHHCLCGDGQTEFGCEQKTWHNGYLSTAEACDEGSTERVRGEWLISYSNGSDFQEPVSAQLSARFIGRVEYGSLDNPDIRGDAVDIQDEEMGVRLPNEYAPPNIQDLDSDGAADLIPARTGEIRLANGETRPALGSTYLEEAPNKEPDLRFFGDYNGDGLRDVVSHANRGVDFEDFEWTIRFGQVDASFGEPESFFLDEHPLSEEVTEYVDWRGRIRVADLDGDGRDELIHQFYSDDYRFSVVSWKGGLREERQLNILSRDESSDAEVTGAMPLFVDLNGDGLSDLLATNQLRSGGRLWARYNTGEGFGPWVEFADDFVTPDTRAGHMPTPTFLAPAGRLSRVRDDTIRVMDVNTDGRPDFVLREALSDNVHLYVSTPHGIERMDAPFDIGEATWECTTVQCQINDRIQIGWSHRVLDVDGNGLPDILYYEFSESEPGLGSFVLYRHSDSPRAERMTRVTTGYQRAAEVRYAPLHDAETYTRGEICDYPTRCVSRRGDVVRQLTFDVGSFHERTVDYTYVDGRYDATGHGGLGFRQVIVTDLGTGVQTTTTSDFRRAHNHYPYLSYPETTSTISFDGHILTRSGSSEVEVVSGPGASYHTVVTGTRHRESQDDGWIETETSYEDHDAYGNARTTRAVVDGERTDGTALSGTETTIKRSFENDATNWRLGMMTSEWVEDTPEGETPAEREAEYRYDGQGALEEIVQQPGQILQLTTRLERHSDTGQITQVQVMNSVADAEAETRELKTNITYDSEWLFVTAVENTLGHIAFQATHPALGVVVASRDANDIDTTLRYDGFGNPIYRHTEGGVETEWSRVLRYLVDTDLPIGWQTSVYGSNGAAAYAAFDSAGRQIRQGRMTESESWFTTYTNFDQLGRAERTSLPIETNAYGVEPSGGADVQWQTIWSYDPVGRMTSAKQADGLETRTDYETGILVETDWDSGGSGEPLRRRRVFTDAMGQVIESRIEHPDANFKHEPGRVMATQYYHGAFGRLMRVVDPGGAEMQRFYDVYDRVISVESVDSGLVTHRYDGFGNLLRTVHPDGEDEEFQYDDLGRVLVVKRAEGDSFFEYDAPTDRPWDPWVGALHRAVSADGIISRTQYDGQGFVVRQETSIDDDKDVLAMEFAYDAFGQIEAQTYPGELAQTVHFAWKNGIVTAVEDGVSGSTLWQLESRDGLGNVNAVTYGNGLSGNWDFNGSTGLLDNMRVDDGDILDTHYAYAVGGYVNSIREVTTGMTEDMTFDYLQRITRWTQTFDSESLRTTYDYHPDTGNLLERHRHNVAGQEEERTTVSFDGSHHRPEKRVVEAFGTEIASVIMNHDVRGRRVSGPWDAVTYTSFDLPRVITSHGKQTTFAYDAFHQRTIKEGPEGRTVTTHGGSYRREHKVETLTVSGPMGTIAEIAIEDGARTIRYVHANYRGDVIAVTDEGGNLIERKAYSPAGRPLGDDCRPASSALMSSTFHGFTGHEHDQELGLINMRGRVFDPESSTFLSQDPIVSNPFSGLSWNGYSYVRHSPTRFTDPSGFEDEPEETPPPPPPPTAADRMAATATWRVYESISNEDGEGECVNDSCSTTNPFPPHKLKFVREYQYSADAFRRAVNRADAEAYAGDAELGDLFAINSAGVFWQERGHIRLPIRREGGGYSQEFLSEFLRGHFNRVSLEARQREWDAQANPALLGPAAVAMPDESRPSDIAKRVSPGYEAGWEFRLVPGPRVVAGVTPGPLGRSGGRFRVRRYMSRAEYRLLKKTGRIPYDPERGTGIPTTTLNFTARSRAHAARRLAAEAADYEVDFDVTGLPVVLGRPSTTGLPEWRVQADLLERQVINVRRIRR